MNSASPATRSLFKTIRVKKEDSVFLYALLEAHEGIVSYSTLDFKPGDAYRDLELRIPPDFVEEMNHLLAQLGDMIYELKDRH